MINLKLNRNTTVQLAWIIMIIYTFGIGRSELKYLLPSSLIKNLCTGVALALLFLKICFLSKLRKKTIIYIALLFVLIVLVTLSSKSMSLPVYFMFIVASADIDIREFIRVDMKTRLFLVIFLFLSGLFGVVSVFSWEINGAVKYSFGWGHPNTFCGTVVLTLLEWLYLNWEKIGKRHYVMITLVFLFLNKFAASRTTIYTALGVITWMAFSKRNSAFTNNRIAKFIYRWIVLIMTGLSWLAVALYTKGSALGIKLNSILTGRLYWSMKYLTRYGTSLWGTDIETISTHQAKLTGESIQILDMSYVRLFIEYGIVYAVFFIVAFYFIGKFLYENNKRPELMLLLYFATVGVGSMSTVNLFSNYMILLFIPSVMFVNYRKKGKNSSGYVDDSLNTQRGSNICG
ncbi:hypothetical protein ACTM9K_00990 [Bariatricus sp. HCP3S3_E12]|uniref:hypothetical protein n=1 Tax=Bariatricus sp. HCP3S3_E12 TaxID=3438906 RepID=UPI003F8BE955